MKKIPQLCQPSNTLYMLLQLLHKKQFKVHANAMLSFQGSFLLMSERSTKLKGGKKIKQLKEVCLYIWGSTLCPHWSSNIS